MKIELKSLLITFFFINEIIFKMIIVVVIIVLLLQTAGEETFQNIPANHNVCVCLWLRQRKWLHQGPNLPFQPGVIPLLCDAIAEKQALCFEH